MTFTELEGLFVKITTMILGEEFDPEDIYLTYPTNGQPGFGPDKDIIFIRLYEKDDVYSKQRDSIYETQNGAVIKKTARTRVWQTQFIAYGLNSHSIINKIKDGVFLQEVKRELGSSGVFLVPDMPLARRTPELFISQWYDRWDLSLTWNELYRLPDENVGAIESVSIGVYEGGK